MKSQLTDAPMDTDDHQGTTTTDNSLVMNQLEELHGTVNILAGGTELLKDDEQRLKNELEEHERKLGQLIEKSEQLKGAVEEDNVLLEDAMRSLGNLDQDLRSLQEMVNERQYVSHDGTLMWKIANFQEKMSE